jgi:SAM-dependent methyltransferase
MSLLNEEYRSHVDRLLADHDREEAMRLAVGGHWDAVAAVEEGVLRAAGLTDDSALVDVGCGSGRLAARLAARGFAGRYLGLDVVPVLVEHARTLAPDFDFAVTDGLTIPAGDAEMDLACFFSVFTHLPFEACFRLLLEARRVVRPGGRVVVSFLELALDEHWPIFQASTDTIAVARHHNQFVHRDDLATLGRRAGLAPIRVQGGYDHVVEIEGTHRRDDGEVVTSPARLGQSWMVFERSPG